MLSSACDSPVSVKGEFSAARDNSTVQKLEVYAGCSLFRGMQHAASPRYQPVFTPRADCYNFFNQVLSRSSCAEAHMLPFKMRGAGR